MNHYIAQKSWIRRRILFVVCVAALAATFTVALPQPAHAEHVTPPPVPPDLVPPEGNQAFLIGHAVGTQNYICLPSGRGFAWTLFTPQATLFNDEGDQLITHFFSVNPNPDDNGAIRATWESSRDTSTIWAKLFKNPVIVQEDAVPWLLLQVVGAVDGPDNGHILSRASFVQRVNTAGGVSPFTGCAASTDVGSKAFVPYTADYVFFHSTTADR